MMREKQKKLDGLIQEIMDQMAERRYGKKTLTRYQASFRLLTSISQDLGDGRLSEKLIKTFLASPASCSEKWASRELTHRKRCIRLLLSLARTGTVDWRRQGTGGISGKLMGKEPRLELESFVSVLE